MQQNRSLYNENLLHLCWDQILAHNFRPNLHQKQPITQKGTQSTLEQLIILRKEDKKILEYR